jgi:hypothetical protein
VEILHQVGRAFTVAEVEAALAEATEEALEMPLLLRIGAQVEVEGQQLRLQGSTAVTAMEVMFSLRFLRYKQ